MAESLQSKWSSEFLEAAGVFGARRDKVQLRKARDLKEIVPDQALPLRLPEKS